MSDQDETVTKKVKVEVEIEATQTNIGDNPFRKIIYAAKAFDAWRIFPRAFVISYLIVLYKTFDWFFLLEAPTMAQAGIISVIVGAAPVFFSSYVNSGKDKDKK